MSATKSSGTQSRLTTINVLFVASALVSILCAWEISKGATLHKLNSLHLKFNYQLMETMKKPGLEMETSNLVEIVQNIRAQPASCIRIIGPFEMLAMRVAGTSDAVMLCKKDIHDADKALASLSAYDDNKITLQQLRNELEEASQNFANNSAKFEPLVGQTVEFVLLTMIVLISIKGLAIAYVGMHLSRRISQSFLELDETSKKAKQNADRLNIALESSNEAIWEWDLSSGNVYASHHFFEHIGLPNPGKTNLITWLGENSHPEDLNAVASSWEAHVNEQKDHDINCRIRDGKGKWRWVRIRGSFCSAEPDSKPTIVTGTLSDVTSFVEAQLQAESANAAKSEFLATVTHEIRTPMTGVIGMLSAISQDNLKPQQEDKIRVALQAADSLMVVLNDILDFSRLEAGNLELEAISTNLRELTAAAADLMRKRAEEKQLRLELDFSEDLPEHVEIDPTRVRQVLINLLSNAIKFTEIGSVTIRLACTRASDRCGVLQFSIDDTGIGIADDKKDRLFRRFSQADPTITRKFGGTGLGLSISQRIVERMGGEIGFNSTENIGSTFWFTVPVNIVEAPQENTLFQYEENRPIRKFKILAAEDNLVNQKVLRALLEIDGHAITIVENGELAVNTACEEEFDIILLDIQMPVMDGYECAKKIRQLSKPNAKTPLVALTSNPSREVQQLCEQHGIDACVGKPVKLQTLTQTFNTLLDTTATTRPLPALSA